MPCTTVIVGLYDNLHLRRHPACEVCKVPLASDSVRFGLVPVVMLVVSINEVTLRWARLVLGWVTCLGFNSWCGTIYLSI